MSGNKKVGFVFLHTMACIQHCLKAVTSKYTSCNSTFLTFLISTVTTLQPSRWTGRLKLKRWEKCSCEFAFNFKKECAVQQSRQGWRDGNKRICSKWCVYLSTKWVGRFCAFSSPPLLICLSTCYTLQWMPGKTQMAFVLGFYLCLLLVCPMLCWIEQGSEHIKISRNLF